MVGCYCLLFVTLRKASAFTISINSEYNYMSKWHFSFYIDEPNGYLECIHIKELGGMITKQMGSAAAATRKNLLNKSMR